MDAPFLVYTPAHLCSGELAIAAARAGAAGILDLTPCARPGDRRRAVEGVHEASLGSSPGTWGVRWDMSFARGDDALAPLSDVCVPPFRVPILIVAGWHLEPETTSDDAASSLPIGELRAFSERVLVEAYSVEDALQAERAGADGVILVGQEAGGRVSRDSAFLLLQRLRGRLSVPYWIRGGMGPQTCAAARLAGASGVVLGEQLWLTDDSPFPQRWRHRWQKLDGSETDCLADDHHCFRFYTFSGRTARAALEKEMAAGEDWTASLADSLEHMPDEEEQLIPLGQEIAFAFNLARRHRTVGGVLAAFRTEVNEALRWAAGQRALRPGAELAQRHKVRYPVLQGPMTRVSDVPNFCHAVAENGAMPFLALALMRGQEVERLLTETASIMGQLPWGVGILGFVPGKLRREQLEVISRIKPSAVIIAGGRPSQANELEQDGVPTYLHVPSPGLLETFLRDGATRFIFEGRECGGHVGPRTSFALWQSAVNVLLSAEISDPQEVHVVFAGGIHDALSAAMVSVIAAPLVARGMRVGVLMGTAYLFTPEAVERGAVTPEFQRVALGCRETALLTSGVGHATRAAKSPFVSEFTERKRQLLTEGRSSDEIRHELELLNLGRLRIASKGVARRVVEADEGSASELVSVDVQQQRSDGLYMIGDVATLRDRPLPMEQLHREVTEGALELLDECAERRTWALPCRARPATESLAIVGMSCLFPDSQDLRSYWQNIIHSFNAIREVPPDRWRIDDFYDTDRFKPDHVYSKWGGFLGDMVFDPLRYRMPPASLRSIEPIQLMALEVARLALEDANYDSSTFPRRSTSVIFAAAGVHDVGMGYSFRTALRHWLPRVKGLDAETRDRILQDLEEQLPKWTEDSFAGFLLNVVAGRIANRFDLNGSNYTVDAACASSLAALQTAAEQLFTHRCDAALVGSVDGTNNPFCFMSFAKTHALSPRGRSFPFDEKADGIGLGEGIGAIVVKRLTDAERDGDRIYAVIQGIGSSSDGRNRSMTAPHPPGQVIALERAYAAAGFDPATVGLVETHSTGTTVGDDVELRALNDLFRRHSATPQACALGSVKSMIGHTKTSAGLASLIKTAMSLKHGILPPTIGVQKPAKPLQDPESPFYVCAEPRPWVRQKQVPRRAGVSSFGFGGTNFHVVMEEYRDEFRKRDRCDLNPRDVEVFFWNAATREELGRKLNALREGLSSLGSFDLGQLAYSVHVDLEASRRTLPRDAHFRLAIVAKDSDTFRSQLATAIEAVNHGKEPMASDGIYYSAAPPCPADQICFLFPGQGSQSLNMLKDLVLLSGCSGGILERADALLSDVIGAPLSRWIYPVAVFDEESRRSQRRDLRDTRIAQPALAAVDMFACELLGRYGIRPAMTGGHSFGEYVALQTAGVLDADALLKLAAFRGQICHEAGKASPGTMAAVALNAGQVAEAIRDLGVDVRVANVNSDEQTIIAGEVAAIDTAVKKLTATGISARRIPVSAAFHTQAMAPAKDSLARYLQELDLREPRIPVFSNTTAGTYPVEPDEIRRTLARHICEPVHFADEVRAMHDAGARVFLEVGPGAVLSNLVRRNLAERDRVVLSLDTSNHRGGWQRLAVVLAHLASLGCPTNLTAWFEHRQFSYLTTSQYVQHRRGAEEARPTDWIVNPSRAIPAHEAVAGTSPQSSQPAQAPGNDRASGPGHPHASGADLSTDSTGGVPVRAADKAVAQPPPASPPSRPSTNRPPASPMPGTHRKPARSSASQKVTNPMTAQKETSMVERRTLYHTDAELPGAQQANLHASDSVAAFQQVMMHWLEVQKQQMDLNGKFLETQQAVMLQALQSDGVPAMPARDRLPAVPQPKLARPQIAPQQPVRVAPAPVLPAAASSPPARTATTQTVSEEAPAAPVRTAASRASAERPSENNGDSAHDRQREPARVRAEVEASDEDRPPSIEEFRVDLLAAISERTGYPVEMLDEEVELEAGLGIDSIKTVEIFGNLKQYHRFLPGSDSDQEETLEAFAQLKTIRDIIETYRSNAENGAWKPGSAVVEETGTVDQAEKPSTDPADRFVLEAREEPASPSDKKKSSPEKISS